MKASAGVSASVFGWDLFDYGRPFFTTLTKVADGPIDFGVCEFEKARACYFEALASQGNTSEGCQGACDVQYPCPSGIVDPLCICERQACHATCGADVLSARSRCFDSSGCTVILADETEASVSCQVTAREDLVACLLTTPVVDGACGVGCNERFVADRDDCLATHQWASIVEDVLGIYVYGP